MNRTNWKYIARYMRAKGYTIEAIEGTIANLGKVVSQRTIYRAIEGVVPETIEFNESLTKPLSMHAILMKVLEYEQDDDKDCQKSQENPYIVGNSFSGTALPAALEDFDESPADDWIGYEAAFSVYYPMGRRTGIQNYLHRCSEQDRQMRKTPEWK